MEAPEKIMQMLHKTFIIFLLLVNSTSHENFYHNLASYIPNSYALHSKRKTKYPNCLRAFCYINQALLNFINIDMTWHVCKLILYIEQCFLCSSCTTHCMHSFSFLVFCQTFHLTNDLKCTETDELQVYSIYFW